MTGFTALTCFVIFALALIVGERDFPWVDWLSLAGTARCKRLVIIEGGYRYGVMEMAM